MGEWLTGNLLGPIVVNAENRLGTQVVLTEKKWTTAPAAAAAPGGGCPAGQVGLDRSHQGRAAVATIACQATPAPATRMRGNVDSLSGTSAIRTPWHVQDQSTVPPSGPRHGVQRPSRRQRFFARPLTQEGARHVGAVPSAG